MCQDPWPERRLQTSLGEERSQQNFLAKMINPQNTTGRRRLKTCFAVDCLQKGYNIQITSCKALRQRTRNLQPRLSSKLPRKTFELFQFDVAKPNKMFL